MRPKVDIHENDTCTQAWFFCPGCKCSHAFTMYKSEHWKGRGWEWNGDVENPTFKPSLLVDKDHPESRCHSFVTNGKIRFLGDSFHHLANKTVDLPELDS